MDRVPESRGWAALRATVKRHSTLGDVVNGEKGSLIAALEAAPGKRTDVHIEHILAFFRGVRRVELAL